MSIWVFDAGMSGLTSRELLTGEAATGSDGGGVKDVVVA